MRRVPAACTVKSKDLAPVAINMRVANFRILKQCMQTVLPHVCYLYKGATGVTAHQTALPSPSTPR